MVLNFLSKNGETSLRFVSLLTGNKGDPSGKGLGRKRVENNKKDEEGTNTQEKEMKNYVIFYQKYEEKRERGGRDGQWPRRLKKGGERQ